MVVAVKLAVAFEITGRAELVVPLSMEQVTLAFELVVDVARVAVGLMVEPAVEEVLVTKSVAVGLVTTVVPLGPTEPW